MPFFGDQPFWGDQVHARGVGPAAIPIDQFSLEKLVDAINSMLDPQVLLILVHLHPLPPRSLLEIVDNLLFEKPKLLGNLLTYQNIGGPLFFQVLAWLIN